MANTGATNLVFTGRPSRRSAGDKMGRVGKQLIVPMTLAALPHMMPTAAYAAEATASPKSDADESASSAPKKKEADSATSSANACITDKAKAELEVCPEGPALTGRPKEPDVQFHGKVEDLKRGTKEIKPNLPSEQMAAGFRDLRKTKLQQRALALLITEIQGLEGLYKTTDIGAKDRPTLIRRLAEGYVELENAAFREQTQAEIEVDDLKKTNPTAAGKKKAIAVARATTRKGARKAAISY